MPLNPDDYSVLTFDCYGTLIDWADGIATALRPILRAHDVELDDEALFRHYVEFERDVEAGEYIKYREVLGGVLRRFGDRFGFTPTNVEAERFVGSVRNWPCFPDTNEALRRLDGAFRLAVVSNVDDGLFHDTARHLGVDFDDVITAEQVRAYKPALTPFETTFTRLGVPPNRLLHVAQSVYHDVNPAGRLGIDCVRVRRYGERFDPPAPQTDPVRAVPDLERLADVLLP
ncbi:haloacid dehalogenase type II [Salinibacter altiplanensis]|uniref:haloacid dehalogenase type II n=1 Tax=Salinibacter altiplanensis TaxID=1803181 RepID=UPI000C9F8509|nr:haloacid dehalogenase type II [Salinibacter altiplanensis]